MKSLTALVNGKELTINLDGCKWSCDFYFKVKDVVYKAYNTSAEECEVNDELFMSCLKDSNRILSHFLN